MLANFKWCLGWFGFCYLYSNLTTLNLRADSKVWDIFFRWFNLRRLIQNAIACMCLSGSLATTTRKRYCTGGTVPIQGVGWMDDYWLWWFGGCHLKVLLAFNRAEQITNRTPVHETSGDQTVQLEIVGCHRYHQRQKPELSNHFVFPLWFNIFYFQF